MSITSSNAILFLGVTNLYATPQQIQGFAADDVYDTEALEVSEASMGVDGILTAGYVNRPVVQSYTLQAVEHVLRQLAGRASAVEGCLRRLRDDLPSGHRQEVRHVQGVPHQRDGAAQC
jgi:hypothetical protein